MLERTNNGRAFRILSIINQYSLEMSGGVGGETDAVHGCSRPHGGAVLSPGCAGSLLYRQ